MNKTLLPFAICAVLGVLLLALAVLAFMNAMTWADLARDGAATGWTVVGVFLLAASISAIAGGWNHSFRVLRRPPRHDH